jgi:hypothetical protein
MHELRVSHKDDPCPESLQKTQTLEYEGFECRVFYNYVPPYGYGMTPVNHWWGIVDGDVLLWTCPLAESVKTLEEAVAALEPVFHKAVDRFRNEHER